MIHFPFRFKRFSSNCDIKRVLLFLSTEILAKRNYLIQNRGSYFFYDGSHTSH